MDHLLEAFSSARLRPKQFAVHLSAMASIGFLMSFLSFSYGRLSCSAHIPPGHVFWIYLLFYSTLFIGTIICPHLIKWIPSSRLLFICFALLSSSFWLLSTARSALLVATVYFVAGFCLGVAHSTTVHSFINAFPVSNFCIVFWLLSSFSLGSLISTCLFETVSPLSFHFICEKTRASGNIIQHLIHGQEKLHLAYRLDTICFIYATAQLPLMYLLLTTPLEPSSEDRIRESYDDIQPEPQDAPCLKLVLLSCLVVCVSTILESLFPFLVLSQNSAESIYCFVFSLFFFLGRLLSSFVVDRIAPYFALGLCIIGTGAASCAFFFDGGLLIGSIIFGLFISPILPSLILYLRHTLLLNVDTLFILLSGSSFGHLIFPLFLCVSIPSEGRVLTAFLFFAVILLVIIFVSMLNVQAQLERTKATQDKLKMFIDRFFSGENLLKRTRSIRPLISRLRPNSYRRFRERRALRDRLPTIEVTLEHAPQPDCN